MKIDANTIYKQELNMLLFVHLYAFYVLLLAFFLLPGSGALPGLGKRPVGATLLSPYTSCFARL